MRREILPRTGFGIFRIALQQALVDIALHIRAHRHPLGFVDHIDQAVQLGRILDLVLRLGENLPQHPRQLAQLHQQRHVMHLQLRTTLRFKTLPVVFSGNPTWRLYGG